MYNSTLLAPFNIVNEDNILLQDNILSPMLTNIFFNEFDYYVHNNFILKYKNKKYYDKTFKLKSSLIKIKYIRYANNFLLGVMGTKNFVIKLQEIIILFFKSYFKITLLTKEIQNLNSYSQKIPFLGMQIYNQCAITLKHKTSKIIEAKKRQTLRMKNRILVLNQKLYKNFRKKILEKTLQHFIKAKNTGNLKSFTKNIENTFLFFLTKIDDNDSLNNSLRNIYKEFINTLLRVSDVKNKQKSIKFLNI
jgi:hypothetical protein